MNVLNRWTRSAAALAAVVPLAVAASSASAAAPLRTATTTSYTTATYLQHALGLPASDSNPVIEPVTYDRFQWLLQQSGNFAVLIGDPAEDATFAARAQDVETTAKAAGVKKVYWFDPNLSGSAKVGTITEPALDIRDSTAIASIAATSQTKYGYAWTNLVGSYLGNGLAVTQKLVGSESATVTTAADASVVNDAGGTGVGRAGALYDYSSGSAPASVSDSFFFIYNGAGAHTKIVSWVDLTKEAGATSAKADATTAIATVGAANLAALDQFAWWKSEVNAKEVTQAPSAAQGGDVPVLNDADDADDWRVEQITYPELVDLLKSGTDANAVILFGGTWCPNTRPVLPFVNKYAQENNVHVFNFDTVLDGGLVGGSTTGASNPLQVRNTVNNGSTTAIANPSFLYGDVVNQYLNNLKTEYDYTTGGPGVTYYPNGDTTGTVTSIRKLQVPYLVGYQGNSTGSGVTRQWIYQKPDGTYTEYMSDWWYTSPQANELGLATTIPLAAPIWSTINSQLASFTWQTNPTTLYANSAIDTDDAAYLVAGDTGTVTYKAANGSAPASVTVASGGAAPIPVDPAALSTALSALGASAPATLATAKTALIAAKTAATPDATLISNLTTVIGSWGVAQNRKTKLNSTWGSAGSPASVAGGAAAVHALDTFFGGLPGGVVSTQSVTAADVAFGTAPTVSVSIANAYGRNPTGNVSLTVSRGGATVASATAAVANGAASFTLPVLDAGTYDYTVSYAGDDQILAFTKSGSFTVSPVEASTTPPPAATPTPAPAKPVTVARIKAGKLKGAISKRPTSRKAGKYKVTITAAKGHALATGKVTIKLKKGKTTRTVTGKLSHGVVTVTVPKLAKGTWKVAISWAGDTNYLAAAATGASIRITK